MLDSFYHMILKLLFNRIFGLKTAKFTSLLCKSYNGRDYVTLINQ